MAIAVGDIIKEALLVVEKVLVKLNEDIERGEVIYNDGAGFLACPNTVSDQKQYIALEAHVYATEEAAGKDHYIRAALMGCICVQKIAGTALVEGDRVVVGATAGEVTKYADESDDVWGGASSVWTQSLYSELQEAIKLKSRILGTVADDAASAATQANIWVGVK